MAMPALTIVGIGMVTSLGPDAANSCAAARATLSRATSLDWLDAGADQIWGAEPVVAHAVRCTNGATGVGKALALGSLALRDLCSTANLKEQDLARTGILINLSDRRFEDAFDETEVCSWDFSLDTRLPSDRWKEATRDLPGRLAMICGWGAVSPVWHCHYGGHAGFADLLLEANRWIGQGIVDRCIVGGIDALIDPPTLLAAHSQGALKAGDSSVGFQPGEAAAFILLEQGIATRGKSCQVVITEVAIAEADRDDAPANGAALARAIGETLATSSDACPVWIGDLNGQESRAIEWGYALVFLNKHFPGSTKRDLWLPAQSFGEIGGATGPVSVCMALRALERGYSGGSSAIVWLSSEISRKAAIKIERRN